MMMKRIRLAAFAALMAAAPAKAFAGGIPVIDASSLAQTIALIEGQARQMGIDNAQLSQLIETLRTAQAHLALAESQYDALTGARDNIAALFAGDISQARIALTLSSINKAVDVSGDVTERVEAIDDTFKFVTGDERFSDAGASAREAVYDYEQRSVKTAIVVAESVFADGGKAFERYGGYRQHIAATPDLKASVDLNTRVQIENGEMLARMLQALGASGQMQAVERAAEIRNAARNANMLGFK